MPDLLRRRRCVQEIEAAIDSEQIKLGCLRVAVERDFARCGNPGMNIAALRAAEESLAVLCIGRRRLLAEERGRTGAPS
jgi:hypothetical protein